MTSVTDSTAGAGRAWRSWLGVVAVGRGVLRSAGHGGEWMKERVILNATPADGRFPAAECPEDGLIEEGLSVAECEQMVSNVRSYVVSAPAWFPRAQSWLAGVGTLLALLSIGVGVALVDRRTWAPAAAVAVFGALTLVDGAGFVAAGNSGPCPRDVFLWDVLLWFFVQPMMTVGGAGGRAAERASPAVGHI